MQGIISATKPSKSGKTLGVLINDTWYSTKHFELAGKENTEIIAQVSTSDFNGKPMHWLNDYTEVNAGSTPASQAFDQAHANYTPPGTGGPPPMGSPQPPQSAPMAQTPQSGGIDRNASITAQALTKAVTCQNAQTAWEVYTFLYNKVLTWKPDAPESTDVPFDDKISF